MASKTDTLEIVLARHGKPQLDHWAWITPRQLADWIPTFNAAELPIKEVPPDTFKKASVSGVVVSSTLQRSVQSAQLLAPLRSIDMERVFCEADLPHSMWPFPKLPLSIWLTVFRVAWLFGYASRAESLSLSTNRARRAADHLIGLARQHRSAFLVGHGIMIRLIAKQLLLLGWNGPKRPATGYWQYTVYSYPVETAGRDGAK